MQLSQSQEQAVRLLRTKDNLFISGPAGTGKSFLIDYYRKFFSPQTPMVASTGMAAILVGGRTFHSFFGLGKLDKNPQDLLRNIKTNYPLMRRIKNTKEIVIDEVSMLSGLALEMANLVCQNIRRNDLPFGGIRVIITGDFFQLPPVTIQGSVDWAFKSKIWSDLNLTPVLLEDFMRTTESDFLNILKSVRYGEIDDGVVSFLNKKIINQEQIKDFEGTRLFSRIANVEKYNYEKLSAINAPLQSIVTLYEGSPTSVERLKKQLIIGDVVKLKKGALVMIRINHPQGHYVNGTLGYVQGINLEVLTLKTIDGQFIDLEKHLFELKDGDENVIASAYNYPINLAYAITIHKSQGSTIDKALIDLKNLWDSGQAYTALSRLKSSSGLFLVGWDKPSIKISPEVVNFYKNLR